ncbi:ABC transporter permease [uncultured Amnibacterium sp.]|uniref:ABC transporter permease n=1 Tax=uncultured Amnibacterium sp. TaxID=1631851 RepID=UPI0035C9FEC8
MTDAAAPRGGRVAERLRLAGLLGPPLAWLVIAYLGSMAVLLLSAFWSRNTFTGQVVQVYTVGNLLQAFGDPVTWAVTLRSIGIAAAVTLIDAVVAIPIGLAMAKVVSARARIALVVAITTPLWASYLVKAYAWRVLLAPNGPLSFLGLTPEYGIAATIGTLAYLWLPYMVLPVFAGFDRVPDSLLEASTDLGASALTTLRSVLLPLVFPAVAAGSIFTFSLSLGDYIAVGIVGGKTQVLGTLIYGQLVTANNQPLAASLSLVPLAAIALYLAALGRTGALENV